MENKQNILPKKPLGLSFHEKDIVAILNGSKTVTRRPITDLKLIENIEFFTRTVDGQIDSNNLEVIPVTDKNLGDFATDKAIIIRHRDYPEQMAAFLECPYGNIGDIIPIQEPWKIGAWKDDGRIAIDYLASPEVTNTPWCYPPTEEFKKLTDIAYKNCQDMGANFDHEQGRFTWQAGCYPCEVQLAETMPTWASRIFVEITDITLEKLQNMTEQDAVAEGMGSPMLRDCKIPKFMQYWDELYDEDCSWDKNPWVWKISFRKTYSEGDKR